MRVIPKGPDQAIDSFLSGLVKRDSLATSADIFFSATLGPVILSNVTASDRVDEETGLLTTRFQLQPVNDSEKQTYVASYRVEELFSLFDTGNYPLVANSPERRVSAHLTFRLNGLLFSQALNPDDGFNPFNGYTEGAPNLNIGEDSLNYIQRVTEGVADVFQQLNSIPKAR